MYAPHYDLMTGDGRYGRERGRQTEADGQRRLSRKTRTIPRPTGSGVFEGNNGKEETHSTRTHGHTDTQGKLTRPTKTGRGIAFGDNGKD